MKNRFWMMVCSAVGLTCTGLWTAPVHAQAATATYEVVTNEISAKQKDGTEREAYRFDPAVYVVQQGDDVVLNIRGLKGHDHPIVLQGYDIRDVIHRNQLTSLRFKANKAGYFRLICTSHADADHEGPMEAYLIVVPKNA